MKPASIHRCLSCLKRHYVLFFPKTKKERRQLPSPARIPRRWFPPAGGRTSAAAATARLPPTSPRPKGRGVYSGRVRFRAVPALPHRQLPAPAGGLQPGPAPQRPAAAERGRRLRPARPGGHLPSADGAISMRVSLAFLPRRFMAPRLLRAPPGPCSPAPAASRERCGGERSGAG